MDRYERLKKAMDTIAVEEIKLLNDRNLTNEEFLIKRRPLAERFWELDNEARQIQKYELFELPEYGDHMTLEEFIKACKSGCFVDSDGYGRYATEDQESNIYIYPSDITAGKFRRDFTHVIWFNN